MIRSTLRPWLSTEYPRGSAGRRVLVMPRDLGCSAVPPSENCDRRIAYGCVLHAPINGAGRTINPSSV